LTQERQAFVSDARLQRGIESAETRSQPQDALFRRRAACRHRPIEIGGTPFIRRDALPPGVLAAIVAQREDKARQGTQQQHQGQPCSKGQQDGAQPQEPQPVPEQATDGIQQRGRAIGGLRPGTVQAVEIVRRVVKGEVHRQRLGLNQAREMILHPFRLCGVYPAREAAQSFGQQHQEHHADPGAQHGPGTPQGDGLARLGGYGVNQAAGEPHGGGRQGRLRQEQRDPGGRGQRCSLPDEPQGADQVGPLLGQLAPARAEPGQHPSLLGQPAGEAGPAHVSAGGFEQRPQGTAARCQQVSPASHIMGRPNRRIGRQTQISAQVRRVRPQDVAPALDAGAPVR